MAHGGVTQQQETDNKSRDQEVLVGLKMGRDWASHIGTASRRSTLQQVPGE